MLIRQRTLADSAFSSARALSAVIVAGLPSGLIQNFEIPSDMFKLIPMTF